MACVCVYICVATRDHVTKQTIAVSLVSNHKFWFFSTMTHASHAIILLVECDCFLDCRCHLHQSHHMPLYIVMGTFYWRQQLCHSGTFTHEICMHICMCLTLIRPSSTSCIYALFWILWTWSVDVMFKIQIRIQQRKLFLLFVLIQNAFSCPLFYFIPWINHICIASMLMIRKKGPTQTRSVRFTLLKSFQIEAEERHHKSKMHFRIGGLTTHLDSWKVALR